MARFRYYLSPSPDTPSAPIEALLSVEADSREDAIQMIEDKGEAPPQWPSVWLHLLLWSDDEQRGFETVQIR